MVITTIWVTRHGFRGNWNLDPVKGEYSTNVPSPTGIASDPALAAHGVHQAEQLATALLAIKDPPITRVYSSPFYRCLETLQPFVEKSGFEILGDNGIGEWYGIARFNHPSPAAPSLLNSFFPAYSLSYKPSIVPSTSGESPADLHDRCAYALTRIISHEEALDGQGTGRAILICTHAASMIAIGRALTGRLPEDICENDFKTYTCGISKFVRRSMPTDGPENVKPWSPGQKIPLLDWKNGKGVAGGWDCVVNCDCKHLDSGEERGWGFEDAETY